MSSEFEDCKRGGVNKEGQSLQYIFLSSNMIRSGMNESQNTLRATKLLQQKKINIYKWVMSVKHENPVLTKKGDELTNVTESS